MSGVEWKLWALVGGIWLGSLVAYPIGFVALSVAAVGVGASRSWWGLLLLTLMFASQLGAWAIDDVSPTPGRDVVGQFRLVTDPEPFGAGLRVDAVAARNATAGGKKLQLRATGRAADDLSARLAGDTVGLSGSIVPRGAREAWLLRRKVVGVLSVDRVVGYSPATGIRGLANSLRRTLEDGAASLDAEKRNLFTGLVVGDDRWQSPQTSDAFRGAGLGHLLAVSGQNVAFVLLLVAPFVRWLPPGGRIFVTFVVLGFFALVTRFEPSVLRASVMAGLSVVAVVGGRPGSGVRLLGFAVAGLLLWDPLLAQSLGFQLSVLASLGIMLVSPLVAGRLVGPRWLVDVVAATIGAQVAVAPLLLFAFDEVPVAALPANVLAGPASGPVMAWGLTGGLLAGFVGGEWAVALHTPTGWLLGWIAGVAEWGATAGFGSYGWPHVVAGCLLAGVLLWRSTPLVLRAVGVVVLLMVGAGPVIVGSGGDGAFVESGVWVWRSGSAVVVELESGTRAESALSTLRSQSVRSIDVLVVDGASANAKDAVVARYGPPLVVDFAADASLVRRSFLVGDLWVRFANSSRGVQVLVDRIETG